MNVKRESEKLILAASQHKKEEDYWLNYLSGELQRSVFPYDYSIKPDGGIIKDTLAFTLPDNICAQLLKLSKNSDYTLHVILMSGLLSLLQKYTDNNDIIIGTPIYKDETDGFGINTMLSIRSIIKENTTFKDLLLQVKKSIEDADLHSNYPIEIIVEKLNLDMDFAFFPLFDVVILLENIQSKEHIKKTKNNITFLFNKNDNNIEGFIEYNSQLYHKNTIERILNHFINFINEAFSNLDSRLLNIDIILKEEKAQILYEFSKTTSEYPKNETLIKQIEERVKKSSNHVALVQPIILENLQAKLQLKDIDTDEIIYEKLSYDELNSKANQLALHLQSYGIEANNFVIIWLDPCLETIISLLAVLKLGAIYVPIGTEFPENRILYILSDTKSKVLLTHDYLVGSIDFEGVTVNVDDSSIYRGVVADFEINRTSESPVYSIYTSGTTGNPKGVIINNQNLLNYYTWLQKQINIGPNDKTLLLSSYAFDLCLTTLYSSLIYGAELHLLTKEIYMSPTRLVNYIKANEISYIKITPSLYSPLVDSESFKYENLQTLKYIFIGGEKISVEDIQKTYKKHKDVYIINHYGPTEATIGCIAYRIERDELNKYIVQPVIGEPINNMGVLILDNNGKVLPIGIYGELCMFGEGLSIGYLNNPTLTNEKFIEHPLCSDNIIYKTGDLARWLPNGKIELKGRMDNQIKIRGYRVELKEIEIKLKENFCIKDAVVAVQEDQNQLKSLSAFIVLNESQKKYTEYLDRADNKRLIERLKTLSSDSIDLEFPINSSLIDRYIEQVNSSSTNISLYDIDKVKISYNTLSGKVNQLVHAIVENFNDDFALTKNEKTRYKRQILLNGWGFESQEKLKRSKVFVAGAGGGASPTIMQLALMGIGTIVVCDFDTVELSNLNRQFLHDESRIGMNKALSAKETINRINPNVNIITITEKLTETNVDELVGDSEIIFDMFDGPIDKFMLSECAYRKGIPHILSAMTDINGYTVIFNPPKTSCFHCIFDKNKLDRLLDNMKAQVKDYQKNPLAVSPTSLFMSSGFAVNEAIKYLLGFEDIAYDRFIYFNSRGKENIANTYSYNSMTYIFSDHFKTISKSQGFDWESGTRGNFLEEIHVQKNPHCPNCSKVIEENDKKSTEINSLHQNTILTTNKNPVVAILSQDMNIIAISMLGALKAGKGFILVQSNESLITLKEVFYEINCRLFITDNKNFEQAKQIINDINHNIKIVNIDEEVGLYQNEELILRHTKEQIAVYTYTQKDNEVSIHQENISDLYHSMLMFKHIENTSGCELLHQNITYTEFVILDILKTVILEGKTFKSDDLVHEETNIIEQIKLSLIKELPDYMMPSSFIEVEKIPTTPNGKLDIKTLQELFKLSISHNQIIPPRNEIEKILVDIWQSVLGRNEIGIDDNFFSLGGDSIKSILIESKIRRYGYVLEVQDIFTNPTIAKLSSKIRKIKKEADQGVITGIVPLAPIQKYFFIHHMTNKHHYNQAILLKLKIKLDQDALKEIFSKIQEHHDALRMLYREKDGEIIQENKGIDYPLEFEAYDLQREEDPEQELFRIANEIQSGINLNTGPLMQLGLFNLKDGDLLLIVIHHLVIDGVSWRILFEDLNILTEQYINNQELKLPKKSDSFKYWSEVNLQYLQNDSIVKSLEYYKSFNYSLAEGLPKNPNPANGKVGDLICRSINLGEEFTYKLLHDTNNAYGTTINDILITSLGIGLKNTFMQSKFIVELEGHGREKIIQDLDISRTIGWFTCLSPILIDIEESSNLPKIIRKTKDMLHRIPNKGVDYGILKYLGDSNIKQSFDCEYSPEILFNYLGEFKDYSKSNFFSLANESVGVSINSEIESNYLIDVECIINSNDLIISIKYNKNSFKDGIIENLLDYLKQALISIIQHCSTKDKQEQSASDFSDKELSTEEFDIINNLF